MRRVAAAMRLTSGNERNALACPPALVASRLSRMRRRLRRSGLSTLPGSNMKQSTRSAGSIALPCREFDVRFSISVHCLHMATHCWSCSCITLAYANCPGLKCAHRAAFKAAASSSA